MLNFFKIYNFRKKFIFTKEKDESHFQLNINLMFLGKN